VLVPSHCPAQAVPSPVQAGRPPCGAPVTGVQVPTEPATSQAAQVSVQALLQQTPSTLNPLWHWFALALAAPSGSLGWHRPPEQ
jgi:hypothetical protein